MSRQRVIWLLLLATVTLAAAVNIAVVGGTRAPQAAGEPFPGVLDEHPAIQYAIRPTRDRVALLNRRLADGSTTLTHDSKNGYLRPVLDALGVPVDSQLLVFSKTGIQRAVTGPRNPRALFFNDSVVVGFIPGARMIEVAAHDPEQGVIFYTLDQAATAAPRFERPTQCLTCHVSASTMEVPGMMTRSMSVGRGGDVLPHLGHFIVNHRTPVTHRWGGWYVTGDYTRHPYGGVTHMGNVTLTEHPVSGASTSNEVFIDWLNARPHERGYPLPDSDIASLMVFDHQMHAINLLTRLNWEARVAASGGAAAVAPAGGRALVEEVVDYFLFVDEAPPPATLTPRPQFAQRFTAAGPRDRRGRSLRELNLAQRLLKYPCSYMIYSDAFEALPREVKTAIYERMWSILSGNTAAKYSHLSAADRRAVIEIVRDTKPDVPETWR